MTPIEISKPGKLTASSGVVVEFSDDTFQKTVDAYDPALHEAPLVVGHPRTDAPAYGWVKSLDYSAGKLKANPDQVDIQFSQMVNKGRFKKVSASFFTPDSPHNPVPGVYYLRHVGFLGAQPPAVKGLKDVSFADSADDEIITVEFAATSATATTAEGKINRIAKMLHDLFVPDEPADFSTPESTATDMTTEETSMPKEEPTVDFAEQQAALDRKAAAIAAREAKLKQREYEDFAESLITDGKLLPADKAWLVEFMGALPDDATLEFAEGDGTVQKPALDSFKAFLNSRPVTVDYSEHAPDANDAEQTVHFSAPQGYTVDAKQAELHSKAKAWLAQHPDQDFAAAVAAVSQ